MGLQFNSGPGAPGGGWAEKKDFFFFFFCQFSVNSYTQCGREGTKETGKGNFFTVSRTLQHATNENAIELQVLFASVRHSWHPLPCYSSQKSGDKPGPLTHSSPT